MIFDISSRATWEANIDIIRRHNLEADMGLHTYTLGMNKYGDLVSYYILFFSFYLYINICRPMKNSINK